MVVAKSLDKILFLDTENADGTVFSVISRKKSIDPVKSVYQNYVILTLLQPYASQAWYMASLGRSTIMNP